MSMTRRLQVLFDEQELDEIQQAARREHLTVAEWVRQKLRAARKPATGEERLRKLDAVHGAARFSFPTADVDQMLAEIESGYLPGASR